VAEHDHRLPPHSAEAERGVIGAMLRKNAVIDDVAEALREDDFYHDSSRRLFLAVLECRRGCRPVDLVILADWLRARGWLADVGGLAALAELWDAVPTAGNVEYHAKIVREKATLRRLAAAARDILDLASRPSGPADDAVDEAARLVAAAGAGRLAAGPVTLDDALDAALRAIDERTRSDRPPGLPSGVEALDALTGGFRPGDLILIGARPSRGKTAVALSFAKSAAWQGVPVFFASCEQSAAELAERSLAAAARLDLRVIRGHRITDRGKELILDARNALGGLQLFVDDSRRQSARSIARQARRLKADRGLAMIVVDYAGLVAPDDARAKRHEQIGRITKDLRDLGRELRVPVLLLAQINRGAEDRGKDDPPRLMDLKDSGDLEQDADTAILLHVPRDRKDDPVWPLQLRLEKQRNGPTGVVEARFIKSQMRFQDEGESTPGGFG